MSGSSLTGLGGGLAVGVRLELLTGLAEGCTARLEEGLCWSFSVSGFAS